MTSITFDFDAIKRRLDQMHGDNPSGTYYRQDESGKVELQAKGHHWLGLTDRCEHCGYYLQEFYDALAPKVCPGKIDGEPCSQCGKNAVVNLPVQTPHFHASRCLACGYLWREYSEAEKKRQAARFEETAKANEFLVDGMQRVGVTHHDDQEMAKEYQRALDRIVDKAWKDGGYKAKAEEAVANAILYGVDISVSQGGPNAYRPRTGVPPGFKRVSTPDLRKMLDAPAPCGFHPKLFTASECASFMQIHGRNPHADGEMRDYLALRGARSMRFERLASKGD